MQPGGLSAVLAVEVIKFLESKFFTNQGRYMVCPEGCRHYTCRVSAGSGMVCGIFSLGRSSGTGRELCR